MIIIECGNSFFKKNSYNLQFEERLTNLSQRQGWGEGFMMSSFLFRTSLKFLATPRGQKKPNKVGRGSIGKEEIQESLQISYRDTQHTRDSELIYQRCRTCD